MIELNSWQQDVERIIYGTPNVKVTICAVERGVGATTLGLSLCLKEAKQGKDTLYWSAGGGSRSYLFDLFSSLTDGVTRSLAETHLIAHGIRPIRMVNVDNPSLTLRCALRDGRDRQRERL